MKKIILPVLLAIVLSCAWTPAQTEPYLFIEGGGVDDTTLLQSAFDTLNDRYAYTGVEALVVLKGTFRLTDTVYLRNKYRVRVFGLNALIISEMTQPALDAQGSTYLHIESVHINSPFAFKYGRGQSGQGGGLTLIDMMINGDIEIADADTSTLEHVTVYGKTTIRQSTSTAKGISVRDCWLNNVDILGSVGNLKFDGCYFTGTVTINGGAYNLSFINSHWERADPPILVKGALSGLQVADGNFSTVAPYLIVIDSTGWMSGWNIGHTTRSNSNSKLIHLVHGTLQYSDLNISSVDIQNETGTLITNSRIAVNGTQPFAGTGSVNKNIITSSYYNTLQTAGLKLDSSVCTGDFCYADTAIVKLQNVQPTTLLRLAPNVTVVYLVFDGKTTIGGAGWYFPDYQTPITPSAGVVMQFINLSSWYWERVE